MQKYIAKDDLYIAGTDGDYLWAEPRDVYLASEVEARIADLESALRRSPCPSPIGDDDTVEACIAAGKCGCENKSLMVSAHE